ncbi:Fic family protein [Parabacteroides sp. PFB2-10]|uniref:Fic family protein n=1 Tax=Parabacteroides sp. PFB2-10 TaxID=1742405 RepID=UPI002476EA94|nr:Fic family protein [Parabacteroides sp. PFB2-10]MDH6312662.1 Fic family protein [Parabacteroides sp. PFB2-10]
MKKTNKEQLLQLIDEYNQLGIGQQIDHDKFYLYSLITHSTAIEGSTVTEVENQLLFDEGISAKGRTIGEQMMNLDLKAAYEYSMKLAKQHTEFNTKMLKSLSAIVMKNTGSVYNTLQGSFDSSKGDLRLVNVIAGTGGSSYMNYLKVPAHLEAFCQQMNERKNTLLQSNDIIEKYLLSFDAHYLLVTIHPWVDGNGRMSRLVMNHLQFELDLIPTKVEKENKAEYIQALIDSREQESLEPFREFMLAEHIRNLHKEIEAYKKSNEFDPLKVISEPQEPQDEPQEKTIEKIILEEIRKNNKITREELVEITHTSLSTIKRRLKKMSDKVVYIGSGYSGHWEIK